MHSRTSWTSLLHTLSALANAHASVFVEDALGLAVSGQTLSQRECRPDCARVSEGA